MRRLVCPGLILASTAACTPLLVNSGLPGPDYSSVETRTLSGNPVLKAETLVQSSTRQPSENSISFSTLRPSILATGTTDANWTHVQGVYLPAEMVDRWSDEVPSRKKWHVAQTTAAALRQCAPHLGTFETLPVAAHAASLRFGQVTIGSGTAARRYYQFLTSRAQWRTELDNAPDGGGNNIRIIPEAFEIYGAALGVPSSRRLAVTVGVEYRFAPSPTASYQFASGAVDLRSVAASCSAGGELQVRGVSVPTQPTGWMPVAKASYNLVVTVREERR